MLPETQKVNFRRQTQSLLNHSISQPVNGESATCQADAKSRFSRRQPPACVRGRLGCCESEGENSHRALDQQRAAWRMGQRRARRCGRLALSPDATSRVPRKCRCIVSSLLVVRSARLKDETATSNRQARMCASSWGESASIMHISAHAQACRAKDRFLRCRGSRSNRGSGLHGGPSRHLILRRPVWTLPHAREQAVRGLQGTTGTTATATVNLCLTTFPHALGCRLTCQHSHLEGRMLFREARQALRGKSTARRSREARIPEACPSIIRCRHRTI